MHSINLVDSKVQTCSNITVGFGKIYNIIFWEEVNALDALDLHI
jgi:hypothetical protein